MKTIDKNYQEETIINNSRFICYLFPLESANITSIIEEIKKEHPKATHYCYGYIFDDIKHASDDGEPSNTAGLPILNVLEKEVLNHILAVVVRYFGGIKLGAGGLVRAYTKSVTNTLKQSNMIELIKGYKIKITFPYEEKANIEYILNKSDITKKEYLEHITYTTLVDQNTYQKLQRYNPIIIKEQYIKKI